MGKRIKGVKGGIRKSTGISDNYRKVAKPGGGVFEAGGGRTTKTKVRKGKFQDR